MPESRIPLAATAAARRPAPDWLSGLFIAVGVMLAIAGSARAQMYMMPPFTAQTGEGVYTSLCQGCHMPGGVGAVGAGAYPALAKNSNLASPAYPAVMVIGGHKAMPAFGGQLSDAQIAEVVNYVRSNFGNHYADKITPEAVKALRPTPPKP